MSKERVAFYSAAALGIAWLSQFAFSKETRKKIGQRDHWACSDCGKRFDEGWMLHASHYDHDRDNPDYDSMETGRMQCVEDHLRFHQEHVGKSEEIGLSEDNNEFAIQALLRTDRRTRKYREEKPQMSLEEINQSLFG